MSAIWLLASQTISVVGPACGAMLMPSGTVFQPVCAIGAVRISVSVWLGQQYTVFYGVLVFKQAGICIY